MKHFFMPLVEKECPVCGKVFFPTQMHAWRDKRAGHPPVCTYSCMRESERIHKANQKKRGRKPKAVKV